MPAMSVLKIIVRQIEGAIDCTSALGLPIFNVHIKDLIHLRGWYIGRDKTGLYRLN